MFGRVLWLALAVLIPVIFVIIRFWNVLEPAIIGLLSSNQAPKNLWSYLSGQRINLLTRAIPLLLSFAFARIVAYLQLDEPSSLSEFAKKKFSENPDYRIITFGHTHNPDQFTENGKCFINTGTWIPIIETSSAELREDKTFTFLHLQPDLKGILQPAPLQRWNDDATREEFLVLVERKDE